MSTRDNQSGATSGASDIEVALPQKQHRAQAKEAPARKGLSRAAKVAGVLAVAAILGGGALEFTPLGAFARNPISDAISKSTWDATRAGMVKTAQPVFANDVYSATLKLADDFAAEHAKAPRSPAIAAYAAFTEYMLQLRFGADAGRLARADGWMRDVPAGGEGTSPATLARAAKAAISNDCLARVHLRALPVIRLRHSCSAAKSNYARAPIPLRLPNFEVQVPQAALPRNMELRARYPQLQTAHWRPRPLTTR
jgi:hypothetical protein